MYMNTMFRKESSSKLAKPEKQLSSSVARPKAQKPTKDKLKATNENDPFIKDRLRSASHKKKDK